MTDRVRQSLSWWCFSPAFMTPETFVRVALDAGYDALELVPDEHWDLVRSSGLAIASARGHDSIEAGLNRREHHARIEAELRSSIERAAAYGVPNVIAFSGNRAGLSDDDGALVTAEGLRRVAPLAEAAGVTIVLELLNSRVDHPDYQADRTAFGVRVCELVASERVKLLYDIYHMQVMEGDLIRTIDAHHQHIAHYHTAGNPGRHEPNDAQEIHYPAVLRAIAATGFQGFVGHEFVPAGDAETAIRDTHRLASRALER